MYPSYVFYKATLWPFFYKYFYYSPGGYTCLRRMFLDEVDLTMLQAAVASLFSSNFIMVSFLLSVARHSKTDVFGAVYYYKYNHWPDEYIPG